MENFLLHRIILKLPQGNQLLYIHVKYGDVHLFKTKKTFSMWNLSISKLCSSVMALCNEEFLREIEFELTYRSFFRLQKMSFYIASDLLLSIVKLFQKQTFSLFVDMRGFHVNPSKPKGKSKEKPKKVKDATHTTPKEDFVINLKDYDSVINEVADIFQDGDRFQTFTEPPVTLDSSTIFQNSFDDEDLMINLISLNPVLDRVDEEFGLDDLEELNSLFLNYAFVINIFSIVFPVTTFDILLTYWFIGMCPPSQTSKWTSDTIARSANKSEIMIRSG